MSQCEVCGNQYDKCFQVITANNVTYVFDSIECAVSVIAPQCHHCQCRILGHGLEANGNFYCCAQCAKMSGVTALRDRA